MDPVNILVKDTDQTLLLDLSGLTREDRVMVEASISNESDFDRIAEALIIQTLTYSPPRESKTSEGQRERRIQTC